MSTNKLPKIEWPPFSEPESKHKYNTVGTGRALILLSGGMDSAACLAFLQSQQMSLSPLFIDYGQSSSIKERAAALEISCFYKVPLNVIEVSGFKEWGTGYINGRNAFLLHTALMAADFSTGIVAIGIHSSTSYVDCSEYFIRQMQSVFDIYTDGRVRISAPFLQWTKGEIWEYCRTAGVPFEITYSCELGGDQPCGHCTSCIDREAFT
jgi:7-cyano-7-deazaguanine synthase